MMKKYDKHNIRVVTAQEHMRLRPKMHFQECFDSNSLDSIPLEASCHAIDEVVDGNCSQITYEIGKTTFSLVYNSGISLETKDGTTKAEAFMTQLFACKNEKKHLHVGHEFCRIGLASVNFASSTSSLVTIENGTKGTFEFKEGVILSRTLIPSSEEDSTEITFTMDDAIFSGLKLTLNGVKQSLQVLIDKFPEVRVDIKEY